MFRSLSLGFRDLFDQSATMHRKLHAAYESVISLEPLDPDASPNEEEAFMAKFQMLRKYVGRMYEHLTGVGEASGVTLNDDNSELAAPPKDKALAVRRLAIIRNTDSDPLTAKEMVEFLTCTTPKSMQCREDEAFIRLIRGYRVVGTHQDLHEMIFGDSATNEDLVDRTIQVDAIQDISTRLFQRERELAFGIPAGATSHILISLSKMINALHFATDWETISADPDSRALKSTYRAEAFNFYHPDFVSTQHTQAEYDQEFKRFISRHEKALTARNTLLKMYNKFGAAVLIDPVWAPVADYTHGSTGRSASFTSVLNTLLAEWSPAPLYVEQNKDALIKLIKALGTSHTYVQNFVNI